MRWSKRGSQSPIELWSNAVVSETERPSNLWRSRFGFFRADVAAAPQAIRLSRDDAPRRRSVSRNGRRSRVGTSAAMSPRRGRFSRMDRLTQALRKTTMRVRLIGA